MQRRLNPTNASGIIAPLLIACLGTGCGDDQPQFTPDAKVEIDAGIDSLPPNVPPTIGELSAQTTAEDTPLMLDFVVDDAETPAGSLAVTVSSSDPRVVAAAGLVLGGDTGSRTLVITPVSNASGTTTIKLVVDDGFDSVEASFDLTVTPVNDPPTITDIEDQTIDEDTSTRSLIFTVQDPETPADMLSVTFTSSDQTIIADENIVLEGTGMSRYIRATPKAHVSGTSMITLTVSDGSEDGITIESFVVTVNPVNDLPAVTNLPDQTVDEDSRLGPIPFTISDVEDPAQNLTIAVTSSTPLLVPNANITLGGAGEGRTIQVRPLAHASGTTTITIRVTDANGGQTVETFVLTVVAVNDDPTVGNVANQTINEDANTGNLAFSISDIEDAANSLVITTESSNPTVAGPSNITLGGTGANRTIRVTPIANAWGITTITIRVRDTAGREVMDTFDLTVNPVNDAPTVSAVANQTINEDGTAGPLAVTISDVDDAAASLTIALTSSNTTLVPQSNVLLGGADESRTITVIPVTNAFGTTTITVRATDAAGLPATRTFTVTVNAVNDTPSVSIVPDQVISEDSSTGTLGFTIGDVEDAATALVVATSSSNTALVPDSGIVVAGTGANQTIEVTPAANAFGTATITIRVRDTGGVEAVTSFMVTVTPINDGPIVSNIDDQVIDINGSSGPIAFTVDDPEDTGAGVTILVESSDTTLVPEANIVLGGADQNRTIEITPTAGLTGTATITIRVRDTAGVEAVETFVVTVTPVNDAPIVSSVADQVIDEDGTTGLLDFTVSDEEDAATDLTITAESSNTALVASGDIILGGAGGSRTIVVTPLANAFGTTTITIRVTDTVGLTTQSSFVVTVNPVNDIPIVSRVDDQTIDEDGSTGSLAFTISDIEDGGAGLTIVAESSDPALVPAGNMVLGGADGNRTITVTPAADASGTTTISIRVTDSAGAEVVQTFVVTVNPVNDAPVALDDSFLGGNGTTGNIELVVTGSVLGNDTDIESALLRVTPVSGTQNTAQNGDIAITADGAFVYRPAPGFLGVDTFTYQISDNDPVNPRTASATVTIEVSPPVTWFVDNTALAAGDGRSHAPFSRLKAVETAPVTAMGDIILVAYGDGTSTNQDEGIVLRDNQILMGDVLPAPPVITNATGAAITLANGNIVTSLVIDAPVGAGIVANGASGAIAVNEVTITNPGQGGVVLGNSAGATFDFDGLDITTSDANGFSAESAGQLSVANATIQASGGVALNIANTTLSGVAFDSVSATNLNGGGVHLMNNTGDITLGALAITNTGDTGLLASSTGSLTIQGATNRIATTNATAVHIASTALDVTLQAVSASNARRGLYLGNTTGAFRVTGDGSGTANDSGGVIQNMLERGIEIVTAENVTLHSMSVEMTGDDGILGSDITGLSLRGAFLSANGDAAGEHGVELANLLGTGVIDGTSVERSAEDGLRIINNRGTLTSLAISDSSFSDSSAALGNGITLEAQSTARMESVSIVNATLANLRGTGVQAQATDTAFLSVSATGSSFTNNNMAWNAITSGAGSLGFDVSNNPLVSGHASHAINVFTDSASTGGTVRGRIANNGIGQAGVPGSGSALGNGLRININGLAHAVIAVENNTIREVQSGRGIDAQAGLGTGRLDLTLANNSVSTDSALGREAIFVASNNSNPVCANIRNNSASGGPFNPGPPALGGAYMVGEGDVAPGILFLEGFAGDLAMSLLASGNTGTPVTQLGINISAPVTPCELP